MFRMGVVYILTVLAMQITVMALAGQTARVGGSGGTKTVTMDCGSNAFIVGITASGGKDGTFGFNLLRKIKFTCRSTIGASGSQTLEAAAAKQATTAFSSSNRSCTTVNEVVQSLDLMAGSFIDRLSGFRCRTKATVTQPFIDMNVGGDGGTRQGVICPSGEGLFKVEARVGDAIDSLKGFCRPL